MKKKLTALALVVVMVAMLFTGLTMAYFTDTDSATNTFTVGDIDIKLEEPSWNPEGKEDYVLENVVPGVPYAKDPYVKNVGSNEAYVRMTVCFQNGVNASVLSGHDLAEFLVGLSSNWTLVDEAADMGYHFDGAHDNCWYATFEYNNILAANAQTDCLFTAVQIPTDLEDEFFETYVGDGFEIIVTAEAIQAQGFDNAEDAFDALDAQ